MRKEILAIQHFLDRSQAVALATVIHQKGSGPRHPGTRMVVQKDGITTGTIGGGLLEAEVIKAGQAVIESGRSVIRHFDMTYDRLSTGTMVCGGTMEVLIELVPADPSRKSLFSALRRSFQKREKAVFITAVDETPEQTVKTRHFLAWQDESVPESDPLPDDLPKATVEQVLQTGNPALITVGERRFWLDPITCPSVLYLFGAGHVSRPTARLGASIDFQVRVLDDRPELVNRSFFPDPIELVPVETFDRCLDSLPIDNESYLVIVTRGHLHDKTVLEQALKTEAAYIGMIGSRKKRNTIYQHLLNQGFTDSDLERVHCPIGLQIGAETPEEIAVSIVGELIQSRASGR